jgi:hypothetical protein
MSSPYLLSPLSHAEGGCIRDRTFPSGFGQSNEQIMAIETTPVPTMLSQTTQLESILFTKQEARRKYRFFPPYAHFP